MGELRRILAALDWQTPVRQVSCRYHWRVSVVSIPCSLVAIVIWHVAFPNVSWFETFFAGMITGGLVGLPIGYAWQLSDKARRSRSSGRYLVASSSGLVLLTLYCICLAGPDNYWQEVELAKIRGIDGANIIAISIQEAGRLPVKVTDPTQLVSFAARCRNGRLFYRNHEASRAEFQLKIELADGDAVSYRASVPARHQDDLAIRFRSYYLQREILIPKGADWLANVGGRQHN